MIKLANSIFIVIPEGEHIFKITGVKYDKEFGTMEVSMATANGMTHKDNYHLIDNNGNWNEGALKAFTYFCRQVMNNSSLTEIDEGELVGHYVKAEVKHNIQPNRKDPSKNVTFVKLDKLTPASGFENTTTDTADKKPIAW